MWKASKRQAMIDDYLTTTKRNEFVPAEFVDWLAGEDQETLNGHVRMQWVPVERHLTPALIRVESLADDLAGLERRFALPPLSGRPGLLESGHHRKKLDGPSGADLERRLDERLPLHRAGDIALPAVDTPRLAGTELGRRLRHVFARDYEAYGY